MFMGGGGGGGYYPHTAPTYLCIGNVEGVSEAVYLVSHLLQKEPDQR